MFESLPEALRARAFEYEPFYMSKDAVWLGLLTTAAEASLHESGVRLSEQYINRSGRGRMHLRRAGSPAAPRPFVSWSGLSIELWHDGYPSYNEEPLVFAAIAELSDRAGIQPYLSNLIPPVDSEAAEDLPPIEEIIAKVRKNEPRYEECSSRWLIAAHFHYALLASLEEDKEPEGLFYSTAGTATPSGVAGVVDILRKWAPWFEIVLEADARDVAAASPREYVATDWKGLDAEQLRMNTGYHRPMQAPWKSDYEDTTSHLFHSAPAFAMTQIKRDGLRPRQGAGLFEHGGYAQHSQGKVFLSNNFGAAKQWQSKVEDQLEHYYDSPKKQVAVMLRISSRETMVDELGDRDVGGSRYTRTLIPPSDIEFFDKATQRWKPVKDFTQGAQAVPEEEHEAHAVADAVADAADKLTRRTSRRQAREVEARSLRERREGWEQGAQERFERERRERASAVHFRATDEGVAILGKWKGATADERAAKAKRMVAARPIPGGPSALSLGERGEVWREALGVDEFGNLVRNRRASKRVSKKRTSRRAR